MSLVGKVTCLTLTASACTDAPSKFAADAGRALLPARKRASDADCFVEAFGELPCSAKPFAAHEMINATERNRTRTGECDLMGEGILFLLKVTEDDQECEFVELN